jgi:hypothetical protein
MWGSQSWLRRTFPGPALAGLKAGCRQDCLPHTVDLQLGGPQMDEMLNHSVQSINQELIVRVDEADFHRSSRIARSWDCRRVNPRAENIRGSGSLKSLVPSK